MQVIESKCDGPYKCHMCGEEHLYVMSGHGNMDTHDRISCDACRKDTGWVPRQGNENRAATVWRTMAEQYVEEQKAKALKAQEEKAKSISSSEGPAFQKPEIDVAFKILAKLEELVDLQAGQVDTMNRVVEELENLNGSVAFLVNQSKRRR